MTAGNFLNRSFGLTTVFLFAISQICGWARRRWLVLRLKKNLGDADRGFLA